MLILFDSPEIWCLTGGLGLVSTVGMGGNARDFGRGGMTGGGCGNVRTLVLTTVSLAFTGGGTCVLLGTAGGRIGTGGGIWKQKQQPTATTANFF